MYLCILNFSVELLLHFAKKKKSFKNLYSLLSEIRLTF